MQQGLLTHGPNACDEIVLPADFPTQVLSKFIVLFDHYGVEKGDWAALSFRLAFTHEPEFKIQLEDSVSSRKTKITLWHSPRLALWWWQVECEKKRRPKLSLEQVCEKVASKTEWRTVKPSRQRYYQAKKDPLVLMLIATRNKLGNTAFAECMAVDWLAVIRDVDKINEGN